LGGWKLRVDSKKHFAFSTKSHFSTTQPPNHPTT
jgi:hypothetical protein